MRRILIWSILTAIVAVILIGVGYWAYWNFFARFQPVTITQNQAEIQRLLDEASWVSEGAGGRPVYVVGYRDSAAMERYLREEVPRLKAGGAEPRFILFARPDREGMAQSTAAERATIAELWLTRDWRLFQRWTSTPPRSSATGAAATGAAAVAFASAASTASTPAAGAPAAGASADGGALTRSSPTSAIFR